MLRIVFRWVVRLRAYRRGKDIWLAIALTLAAAVFIAAALVGQQAHVEEPPRATADN
jgi:hypothetical protein